MALKDMMKLLGRKKDVSAQTESANEPKSLLTGADFPMIPASSVDLNNYHKVPLMGLAALGAAFSTLPEAARTITQTVTRQVGTGTPVFAGFWPDGVLGKMLDKGSGFSGNITDLDGSNKIVGRMRYKLINDGLPLTTSTNTVIPFNPMTMVIAAALIRIEKNWIFCRRNPKRFFNFLSSKSSPNSAAI